MKSESMKQGMSHQKSMDRMHYRRLFWMVVLAFVSMYILMYAMADQLNHVYNNLNEFYMAGLMAAPMLVIELLLMGSMYNNKRLNMGLMVAGVVAAGLFWVLIRSQAGITDRQFLRSMIPHHAGAILMCQQSRSTDPQIQKLCAEIITSQQSEIATMKALLHEGN